MGRPKKLHYPLNYTVVFLWSGVKRIGKIHSRTLRGKKMYYDVLGENGKIYEELYTDDSEIACILAKETSVINKSLEKKLSESKNSTISVPEQVDDEEETF